MVGTAQSEPGVDEAGTASSNYGGWFVFAKLNLDQRIRNFHPLEISPHLSSAPEIKFVLLNF